MKKKVKLKIGDICPTCGQHVKVNLSDENKEMIAKRHLRGETKERVATEYGISYGRVLSITESFVAKLPGFDMDDFTELLREPNIGMTAACRQTYWKLTKP